MSSLDYGAMQFNRIFPVNYRKEYCGDCVPMLGDCPFDLTNRERVEKTTELAPEKKKILQNNTAKKWETEVGMKVKCFSASMIK